MRTSLSTMNTKNSFRMTKSFSILRHTRMTTGRSFGSSAASPHTKVLSNRMILSYLQWLQIQPHDRVGKWGDHLRAADRHCQGRSSIRRTVYRTVRLRQRASRQPHSRNRWMEIVVSCCTTPGADPHLEVRNHPKTSLTASQVRLLITCGTCICAWFSPHSFFMLATMDNATFPWIV